MTDEFDDNGVVTALFWFPYSKEQFSWIDQIWWNINESEIQSCQYSVQIYKISD